MADSAVAVTQGTGTNIDTRTETTNGNHRQVVVIGDGATNAGIAPVDVTNGLAVQVIPALPVGDNVIGKVKLVTSAGVTIDPDPQVLHDDADSGGPIKVGAKAATTQSTATLVAAGDRSDAIADLDGALLVRYNNTLGDISRGRATTTGATSVALIAAAGASIRTYITDITIANSSSTFVTVDILDGASVMWTFPVPPSGGVTHKFGTPLRGSVNTAWNFQSSGAVSTITCSGSGFKSKA